MAKATHVLFDITKGEVHRFLKSKYKVNGKEVTDLPNNLVQLEMVYELKPSFDPNEYRVKNGWTVDIENGEYRNEFELIPLTQYEKDMRDWKYDNFELRFIVDEDIIMAPESAPFYIHFQLNNLPIEKRGDKIHLWAMSVLPQHEGFVNQLESLGKLTVKYKPQENV